VDITAILAKVSVCVYDVLVKAHILTMTSLTSKMLSLYSSKICKETSLNSVKIVNKNKC
jgi:hypothetical protein